MLKDHGTALSAYQHSYNPECIHLDKKVQRIWTDCNSFDTPAVNVIPIIERPSEDLGYGRFEAKDRVEDPIRDSVLRHK